MSIRVIIQNNPFSEKYEEKKMEVGISLRGIVESLNLDPSISSVLMMVEDNPTTSFEHIPEDGARVLLKIVPAGDENTLENVMGALIIGAAIVTMILVPGLGVFIGGGILIAYYGYTSYADDVESAFNNMIEGLLPDAPDTSASPSASASSYLRGGTNTSGIGSVVPLILGRHRYYPMQIATPSVQFITGGSGAVTPLGGTKTWFADTNTPYNSSIANVRSFKQQINQLYLLGHKEVQPEVTTYKRGDTLIENLPGTIINENSLSLYGATAKKYINVSKSLGAYDAQGYKGIEVIIQQGTTSVDFSVVLPTFWLSSKDNKQQYIPRTFVRAVLKNKDTDTIVYEHIYILDGTDELKAMLVPPVAITVPVDYVMEEGIVYSLALTRGADDPTQDGEDDDTVATGHVYKNDDWRFATNMTVASITCLSLIHI